MTKKPTANVAASVRARLMKLRDARGGDYNALLTQYAIERFLYRLSKSSLAKRFTLKGAMLFRVWSGDLHRPTRDLDLLGQGDATPDAVADAVRQVLITPVADDGLTFDLAAVTAGLIREENEYGGIRVRLAANLGGARIPMQIDVGFGDAITPGADLRAYPTLLDMEAPKLKMYPPETVVAEKLQAMVMLGMTNSRMKDYYDLLVVFRRYTLDTGDLARAIAATFKRRKTDLPTGVPVGLSDEFAGDKIRQRLWHEFLSRLDISDAPMAIADVIQELRPRILPLFERARQTPKP